MIDHLSIGVRDIARSKRFYDAALAHLGYTCLSHGKHSLGYGETAVVLWIGAAERPVTPDNKSGLHVCLWLRRGRASTHFTRRRWRPVGRMIMAGPGCAPITAPHTTRLSWSTPTATGSKPVAAPSCDG